MTGLREHSCIKLYHFYKEVDKPKRLWNFFNRNEDYFQLFGFRMKDTHNNEEEYWMLM